MHAFPGTCRLLCRSFQRACMIIPDKTFVQGYCKRNLVIGLVPLVPSVYAQSDIKSNSNAIVKSSKEDETPTKEENSSQVEENDGWKRLQAVFMRDEYGNTSKEMTAVTQSTILACLVGFIYGGTQQARIAFIDFMERNQASIFENHLDAKRRLQNHVTVHFGKGAFKWAIRLSLFTGGFTLFLSSMAAYRGHSSVLDYALSGGVVGGLIRIRLGPSFMVVGGILGTLLGLVCGLTTHGLLNLFDTNIDEVIAFQYELDRRRQRLFLESEKKSFEDSMNNPEAVSLLKDRPTISSKEL